MIRRVLVLCLGNICRSPIGEVLLKKIAKDHALALEVDSAGLTAMVGEGAHPFSQELMAERGISLKNHRAKQVTTELIKNADLILVMDDAQKRMLEQSFHDACGKTFRIGHHSNFDVPDPYHHPRAVFEGCAMQIERGLKDWVDFIV